MFLEAQELEQLVFPAQAKATIQSGSCIAPCHHHLLSKAYFSSCSVEQLAPCSQVDRSSMFATHLQGWSGFCFLHLCIHLLQRFAQLLQQCQLLLARQVSGVRLCSNQLAISFVNLHIKPCYHCMSRCCSQHTVQVSIIPRQQIEVKKFPT